MYVIEATITAGNITAAGLNDGVHYLPADRCHWQQRQAANGTSYEIANVFYNTGAAVVDIAAGGSNTFRLGYIAKTGRFVGMTV